MTLDVKDCKSPIPTVLLVNREFRQAAQRVYKLSFEYQLGGRPIYFNFEEECLLFSSGGAFDLFKSGIHDGPNDTAARQEAEKRLRYVALWGVYAEEYHELPKTVLGLSFFYYNVQLRAKGGLNSCHWLKGFTRVVNNESYEENVARYEKKRQLVDRLSYLESVSEMKLGAAADAGVSHLRKVFVGPFPTWFDVRDLRRAEYRRFQSVMDSRDQ
ncbi:hypothetical protein N431DRAFT_532302 [Stipitochalara longipes BDJ]|nr:hypothetical protein N431DRAFT_532302 [Stipitochalara longipes BDJ]